MVHVHQIVWRRHAKTQPHQRRAAVRWRSLPACRRVAMLRERSCEPPPHDMEHVDQALYSDSTQSSGQLFALQSRVSS